ncbi:hypothetical protein GT037_010129 [Alternaria burnsii]|uniref:Tetrapyrrole biosynthesis uroporphyrinogen III synthase domain-containing protein n=1 Tax=Alternaria burnsii TaxID=1187904 RepID=A0A8H7AYY2_9PLEO|nr:uncharacterized protein GT037_010129 [Alternaria burnsii]KAF7671906.1 hypothetical protein GT037_010129 [Alternaria burnsii]
MAEQSRGKIPILLLKTKSIPKDTYEELFLTLDDGRYAPVFVPVLEHRFKRDALHDVRQHVTNRGFVPKSQQDLGTYGALIFTSQRAVEAFSEVVEEIRKEGSLDIDDLLPQSLPLYVVGPATARGLRSLHLKCPILGEETGNGEALAGFILKHYNALHPDVMNPPILFMVGDKRRDIIPKTLQSEELDPKQRAKVDEVVIYETGEMQSFMDDFSTIWRRNADQGSTRQWVVVFSPSGCQAMLESLGLLDTETGKAKARSMMAGTRSSARKTDNNSSPAKGNDVAAGTKRKPEVEPSPKRGRKASKKQATIEETMDASKLSDSDTKDASDDAEDTQQEEQSEEQAQAAAAEDLVDASDAKALATGDEKPSTTEENTEEDTEAAPKADEITNGGTTQEDTPEQDDSASKEPTADGEGAIESSSQRAKQMPSNILEKGVIYFFTRNRVGIEESESVGDLQRTFFVLRPMPSGAKLGDGALADSNNIRLFALPKKVFPKSHNDRFMAFVEKANTSIKELKETFFGADEFIDEFRGLAWVEVKPKYLDYEYCQILLIGEKMEAGVEPTTKDQKHDKETPQEEIEKLEHEDELRVEHLHGDDSVYDDLKISKKEYPQVATTW